MLHKLSSSIIVIFILMSPRLLFAQKPWPCAGDASQFCKGLKPTELDNCLWINYLKLSDQCKQTRINDYKRWPCVVEVNKYCHQFKYDDVTNLTQCLGSHIADWSPDCKTFNEKVARNKK